MFLALLIFPLCSLFHILIHALFKSLLFLLAGSLIHLQSNFQSIYKMKLNNSCIKIIFLLAGSVLILSFSKEAIIHCSNYILSSGFVFGLAIVGGFFTTIYTLKIYIYCFYLGGYKITAVNKLKWPLAGITISSIFIDQSLDSFFSLSFFYSISFESLLSFSTFDSILHFSLLFFFSIPFIISIFFLVLINVFLEKLILFSSFSGFSNYSFDSSSSFFIPPFQYFFLLFSSFFFKAPIHSIEVFRPALTIHYFTSFQLILFFFLLQFS